jgi:hypothetical protein
MIGITSNPVPFMPPFAIPIKKAEINKPIQLHNERFGKKKFMEG